MTYKGIVFFDYDGTLADEKEGIYYPTDTTKSAIKKLQENGYLAILATGRSKCCVPETGIDFDGYVTSNGGYSEVLKKPTHSAGFNSDEVLELSRKFEEIGLCYSWENQQNCFSDCMSEPKFLAMLDNFKLPRSVFIPKPDTVPPDISKLLITYDYDLQFDKLKEYYNGRFLFDKHRGFMSADVAKYGVEKSLGVRAIAGHLEIDADNIYAFGDGTNDYGMLKYAGHAICMGYHAPVLEEICETITDTVINEGIYKALKKYNLI